MYPGRIQSVFAPALIAVAAAALLPLGPEARASAERSFSVVLGGDVLLGRGIARRAATFGWDEVLGPLAGEFHRADLAIVNLESPLAPCLEDGTVRRPRLCGDPSAALALARSGIDAVTLANNHALDGESEGLARTERVLREAGVAPLGAEAARNGAPRAERLGDLSVIAANLTAGRGPEDTVLPVPSRSDLGRAIRISLRNHPSLPVLVTLHAGREHHPHPQSRDLGYARVAAEAGASAVVMHGAHLVRPLVWLSGKPVHLGLGNLIFDQRLADARQGVLLFLSFRGTGPARVSRIVCIADGVPGPCRP